MRWFYSLYMRLNILFGKKLKELRESRGYTQHEFAELCELHPTTIGMIEIGKRVPSFSRIELFAEKLGVSYSTLFDYSANLETTTPLKLKEQLIHEIEGLDSCIIKEIIRLVRSIKIFSLKK